MSEWCLGQPIGARLSPQRFALQLNCHLDRSGEICGFFLPPQLRARQLFDEPAVLRVSAARAPHAWPFQNPQIQSRAPRCSLRAQTLPHLSTGTQTSNQPSPHPERLHPHRHRFPNTAATHCPQRRLHKRPTRFQRRSATPRRRQSGETQRNPSPSARSRSLLTQTGRHGNAQAGNLEGG